MTPNFDEIVGSDLSVAERERLRQVHELLVVAGPPPELSPELRRTPIPDAAQNVHPLRRKTLRRRTVILIAAALVILIVAIGGFSGGHTGSGKVALSVAMHGTAAAKHAQAELTVYRPTDGNWPMRLNAVGLPPLPAGSFYEVYLVRNGKPWGSCGTFRVDNSSRVVSVPLNAPYALRKGDTWVVTREGPHQSG